MSVAPWSFSRLKSFEQCPKQFYHMKIAKDYTEGETDAMRYGSLDGSVIQVSPDTLITPEGSPFYKVRIELEQAFFQRGKFRHELFPGMQVMTSIQTGDRTVLQYLLDPVMFRLGDAMQER